MHVVAFVACVTCVGGGFYLLHTPLLRIGNDLLAMGLVVVGVFLGILATVWNADHPHPTERE